MFATWGLVGVLSMVAAGAGEDGDREVQRRRVETGLVPAARIAPSAPSHGVRWSLEDRMRRYRVPGVSIAVIRDFNVEWAAGYGVRDARTRQPVDERTLFQAGSISKPLAALAALELVEAGKLSLTDDVRRGIRSWTMEENEISRAGRLTLAALLSHRGGTTVHGFLGYPRGASLPTVPEVLSGSGPANSPPVFMDLEPDGTFRYSGGGTTIAQLLMTEVTGEEFPALARRVVFEPLGMKDSTYEQPLPTDRWPNYASGHLVDGDVTPSGFHVHPEMAAAGLWTTAGDIARYVVAVMRAHRGDADVLGETTVERILTAVDGGPTGLGVFIDEKAGEFYFQHGGSNVGFKNQFYGHRDDGYGAVVMTNGDQGGDLIQEILNGIAEVYGWHGFLDDAVAIAERDESEEALCVGRYELADDRVLVVEFVQGELSGSIPTEPPDRLYRVGERAYVAAERGVRLTFDEPGDDGFEDVYVQAGRDSQYGARLDPDEIAPSELLLHDPDGAVAAYRARYDEDADDPSVSDQRLNGLAYRLMQREGLARNGVALARLNVELHPRSANSLDTLARGLAIVGEDEAAVECYSRVIDVVGEDDGISEPTRQALAASARAALADLAAR